MKGKMGHMLRGKPSDRLNSKNKNVYTPQTALDDEYFQRTRHQW